MTGYIDPNSSYAEDAESEKGPPKDGRNTPETLRVQAQVLQNDAEELESLIIAEKFLVENPKVLKLIHKWFHNNRTSYNKDLMVAIEERRRKLEE